MKHQAKQSVQRQTLDTSVRLATELHTMLDDLVFGEDHRSPDDDLKLQLEALSQFKAINSEIHLSRQLLK